MLFMETLGIGDIFPTLASAISIRSKSAVNSATSSRPCWHFGALGRMEARSCTDGT